MLIELAGDGAIRYLEDSAGSDRIKSPLAPVHHQGRRVFSFGQHDAGGTEGRSEKRRYNGPMLPPRLHVAGRRRPSLREVWSTQGGSQRHQCTPTQGIAGNETAGRDRHIHFDGTPLRAEECQPLSTDAEIRGCKRNLGRFSFIAPVRRRRPFGRLRSHDPRSYGSRGFYKSGLCLKADNPVLPTSRLKRHQLGHETQETLPRLGEVKAVVCAGGPHAS